MSFIPGMTGAVAGLVSAATPPLTAISFYDSAADTALTTSDLALPSGIQPNDIIFVSDYRRNSTGSASNDAIASGYTALDGFPEVLIATNVTWTLSVRVAVGGETSIPFNSGGNANIQSFRLAAVFRPNGRVSSVEHFDPDSDFNSGNPAALTTLASGGTPTLIALGCYFEGARSGTVSPRTMTPTKDGEVSIGSWNWLAWKIYNVGDTPANVTIDMDDEGNNNFIAVTYVEIH